MPSQVIDLSDLTTEQGFIIQGDAEGDRAGLAVSSAGDVNGDGIDDIIVGAPFGDDGASPGAAYVIYGKAASERSTADLSSLAPEDGFVIQGNAERDYAGRVVSSAGDINGDGINDIIVGARFDDGSGNLAGEAYVIYGTAGANRETVDVSNLSPQDGFIIQGDTADNTDLSISSGGDVNGDGIDDIVFGARQGYDGGDNAGQAYVIYGSAAVERDLVDLSELAAVDGFTIQGAAAGDQAGRSVASAGDVNGDGIDDIIVAGNQGGGGGKGGKAYVIYGTTASDRGTVDLDNVTAADGFLIQGDPAFGALGYSVSSAGDINGDGIDDIVVGSPFGREAGKDQGVAYVIYGTVGTDRELVNFADFSDGDGFIIQGGARYDRAGISVSSAGDVNGDGIDDIIVGARDGDEGGNLSGQAYVIYGTEETDRGTIGLGDLDPSDGFIIKGDEPGDQAGISVSSGGDVNGDGIDDIVVGASRGDDGGTNAGEAYVIYGAATTDGQVLIGSGGADDLPGGDGGDVIVGIAGNDELAGGLGSDLIIGGFDSDFLAGEIGDDIIVGDNNDLIAGADTLIGGVGDDLLEGGGGADTFVFAPNEGHDTIGKIAVDYDNPHNSTVISADFVNGVDLIMLEDFNFDTEADALAAMTDVNGVATFSSQGTTITFVGLTTADFTVDDFALTFV